MVSSERPDRISVAFDDPRLVANAGLMVPLTLARRLGLGELVDNHLDLGDAPGESEWGRQDVDPGGIGPGRGRLHRRCGRAASRRYGGGAGL